MDNSLKNFIDYLRLCMAVQRPEFSFTKADVTGELLFFFNDGKGITTIKRVKLFLN